MASHPLIDTYIIALTDRLPAETVDELADGLIETWQRHVGAGLNGDQAARAAIAEFGAADGIVNEFVTQAPGRRIARLLLATGPIMGACWGTSLIAARVWTWPIPPPIGAVFAVVMFTVVAALLAAATTRHSYRRARLGSAGALALVALDATMIAAVTLLAPALVWPMAVALPASLARIGLVVHWLPRPRHA